MIYTNWEQKQMTNNNDVYITSKFTDAVRATVTAVQEQELAPQPKYDFSRLMPVNTSRMIWVTFQKEGIHKYPAALTDPALATGDEYDVSFLGYPHRHTFHFRVSIQVQHNDRDIEFIQFKRWLNKLYDSAILELDYRSCEMIAEELYDQISERYPGRTVEIEVSEDNENGCKYKWEPENEE
jgi:hypothetical protein